MGTALAYADAEQEHKFQQWALRHREEPRYEILDGVIYLMASPSVPHSEVVDNIKDIFKEHIRRKGGNCCVKGDNVDLHLEEKKNVVVPDVMIVCNRDLIKRDGVHGAPDLIVEVLSRSTRKRDLGCKLKLYERCGVKEYWIVNLEARTVAVYHLVDGRYEVDNVYDYCTETEMADMSDDEKAELRTEIKVSLYDDLIVKTEDIFRNVMFLAR